MKSKWVVFVLINALFVSACYFKALRKPLWTDETYGIQVASAQSIASLLIEGAHGQGSPSPLFYLLIRPFSVIHDSPTLAPKAWKPELYWRLLPGVIMILGALLILLLSPPEFGKSIPLWGVFLFLFAQFHFYYAVETRPYSLWVVISILMLLGIFREFREPYWWVVFPIIAATATASMFQIAALGGAYLLCDRLLKSPPTYPIRLFGMLALGLIVALYYGHKNQHWGYTSETWGTWPVFFGFCKSYKWPFISSLALSALYLHRKNATYAWLTLGMFLTFCSAPVSYWITRRYGFFFSERQYIYWTTQTVVLMMLLTLEVRDLIKAHGRNCRTSPLFWGLLFLMYVNWRRLDAKNTLDEWNHALGSPFTLIKRSGQ